MESVERLEIKKDVFITRRKNMRKVLSSISFDIGVFYIRHNEEPNIFTSTFNIVICGPRQFVYVVNILLTQI